MSPLRNGWKYVAIFVAGVAAICVLVGLHADHAIIFGLVTGLFALMDMTKVRGTVHFSGQQKDGVPQQISVDEITGPVVDVGELPTDPGKKAAK